MRATPNHRSVAAMLACNLFLLAVLLVESSHAIQSSLTSVVSSSIRRAPSSSSSRLAKDDNSDVIIQPFSGAAFVHRARRASESSCKSVDVCNRSRSDGSSPMQTFNRASNNNSLLDSVLSIRGGASSSSDNAIQSIVKSIMASSLPPPIKKVIVTICLFIENLTGFKVLPVAEQKQKQKKSKSKKTKSKEREVMVEEVSNTVGVTKKKKKKRSPKRAGENDLNEVKPSAVTQKKRRAKISTAPVDSESESSDSEEVKATTTTEETKQEATPTPAASKPKPKRSDAASQKFLANKMKSSNPNYRIQRELKEFLSSPPPGLRVKISGKNVRLWVITLSMPDNTIYSGDTYKLRVQFPNDYPTSPPSVYFLNPTPRHEHVYTNGDICLSLLGKDWRPIMTAQSIAQAIMSILCGAQRKSLPMDNARHAGNKPGKKQDDWVYHDDNC